MDWKTRIACKIYYIWRYFYKPTVSTSYILNDVYQWDLSTDIDSSCRLASSTLSNRGWFHSKVSNQTFFQPPPGSILEIRYNYMGQDYRILCDGAFHFPPYPPQTTSKICMFEKDIVDIRVELYDDEEDGDDEEFEIEVQEQPDMYKVLFELRGPCWITGNMFHSDIPGSARWEVIQKWLKKFYLQETRLSVPEKNLLMTILWSNGESESF